MTSNRVSKPTPMLRCAQIKGAPWLEISKIGTAPSCLWIAGGGGGGPGLDFCGGGMVQSSPREGRGLQPGFAPPGRACGRAVFPGPRSGKASPPTPGASLKPQANKSSNNNNNNKPQTQPPPPKAPQNQTNKTGMKAEFR